MSALRRMASFILATWRASAARRDHARTASAYSPRSNQWVASQSVASNPDAVWKNRRATSAICKGSPASFPASSKCFASWA